ncbi:MAG: Lipopolysaccharide biosynthesis protein wbpB [Candidatus Shapirobacteria bacterium GW2011_GWE1_38_10]|uniref:Lipopolysaccharide biosynthesis protein wbpB n=2 Tax=Patescibacteria group TaxID=1783273 RepID=A0A0G0IC65_9BACT|nr:MAG: Lipopolysaccharide biosynthesis protein wbpB [Candidatus Shapirobacteria bacterium GW2011_GWE1_38_10]KKR20053.1 MAG: Lipopolysaccharide biosynthesis protein wbpB [Candidatus Nomurabacteria bacterium GW2011_GWC2_39_41]
MKKRFAIIGKGFIFSRHKQAIEANGGEVYLTCDIDVDKNPDFIDWVEMFNHPKFANVDYVSICAPNYLHSIIAREALFKGKKVLCEKPLSINGTKGMDGTMTVLQLRHHPKMQKIKKPKELFIEAKMFRDEKYWNSWKGNDIMSGGVLFNLGIHYIDLAIFLLGNKWKILRVYKKKRKVVADIRFGKSLAHVHIEIVSNRKKQGRKLLMDGQEIILSNQDNLSYEDLHKQVYQDFLAGKGVTVKEAEKSLKLTSAILCF